MFIVIMKGVKMRNLKERIYSDELLRIEFLESVLFDLLGKDSLTSKELEYYEKDFLKCFREYTRNVLKNHDSLVKLPKREFNLEIEKIGCELLTSKLESLTDCAIETGACICMIVLKTLTEQQYE